MSQDPNSHSPALPCPLCDGPGGELIFNDGKCRIVLVEGAEGEAFPGFCRLIWNRHIKEMSELSSGDRRHLLHMLDLTERLVAGLMHPDKINLASFGNMVPHLHWHIIPRWQDDSHFPDAIWAHARRPAPARPRPASQKFREALQPLLAANDL